MSNQQQKEKIEWPGDWCFPSCYAFCKGWSTDRSGFDAINRWGETATEAEKAQQLKRAESYGWFVGYAAGYAATDAFCRWLFGE